MRLFFLILMSQFFQDFEKFNYPRFVQGSYLRTILTLLPYYAEKTVSIMVPYLVKSAILDSILGLPDFLDVRIYTRDSQGYLPNIKPGAQPALDNLVEKEHLSIFIDNRIHAKIWLIDRKFAIVHSMNGTFHSENINFEAGIVSVDQNLIAEIANYFEFVEGEANSL